MWIEEQTLQDGTAAYRYCERYVDPNTGKRRKISVTLPTRSRPAIKHATAMLAAKIKAKLSDSSYTRVTFEQAAREYEKYRAPALKISTRRNINGIINRLIRMLPPDVLVSEIKLPMIQKGVNDLQERGLKRAYIAKHADTFRSIIRFARKMGYVKDIAYLEDIEVQRQPSTLEDAAKQKYKFLDADQLKAVLDELKSMHYRMGMAIEFMSLTGLRFGELAALRVQDYDREAAKININGTILPFLPNGHPKQRGTPKTSASYRDVALDSRAVTIIEYFIADNTRLYRWWKGYENYGYIFTTARGTPFSLREVNRYLRKISCADNLSTHVFRHTHVSLLLAAGVPIKAVMERVGHSSMKTTMEIYTHVTKTQKEVVINAIEKIRAGM